MLTMKGRVALTKKFYQSLTINVLSSFAVQGRIGYTSRMNQTLFMFGDWPVRVTEALLGFAALTLILLLTIAIAVARSGSRGATIALAQAVRADELEQRLDEVLRAQSEANGRVDAMTHALSGR